MEKIKITLVRKNGIPISIGVGRHCFEIINNKPVHDEFQSSDVYSEAYQLASWAIEANLYDNIEDN